MTDLVAGRWRVDTTRPLPAFGGGLPAFAANDTADNAGAANLLALRVARDAPLRAGALVALQRVGLLRGVLLPVAHGHATAPDGVAHGYVICPLPSGTPVIEGLRPWPEHEIMERVVKPAAAALAGLSAAGVTHRAIRPNNVFAEPGKPVALGCAWAAPPAADQPAVFEPPYSAVCAPAARGNGTIADDVYALGVLLLTLALGRIPLAALAAEEVIRRKLELGSHAALTEGERVPPLILDLTRGMLAEDPEHRPPPSLLADSAAARARRVMARQPRRAQRPQEMGGAQHWHMRTLALACARHPKEALTRLKGGEIELWLRRCVGDSLVASQIEEAVAQHQVETASGNQAPGWRLLMRAVVTLDPLLPPCWQGVLVWPDGLGPALAAGADRDILLDLVQQEAVPAWVSARRDSAGFELEARRWRSVLQGSSPALGAARLRYVLNPLQPCGGRLGAPHWVADIRDTLPTLERIAADPGRPAQPFDMEMAAFIAATLETAAERNVALAMDEARAPSPLQPLRLAAILQLRRGPPPLPALAAWLADCAAKPTIESWASKARRAAAETRIRDAVAAGRLSDLLAVLDDPAADHAERDRLQHVRQALLALDGQAQAIAGAGRQRRDRAEAIGHACAAGLGSLALAATLALALL